ncbi:hypothetical protein [Actinomycetospora endophytica]|uniref:hypothetical protein n=1 Tax=Actinomycetospora endophytica TaxID=2291215 RepID=UPI00355649B0
MAEWSAQVGAVGGAAWSSDGQTLAIGSDDRSVALWNMADPGRGAPVGDPIIGHTDSVYSLGFPPTAASWPAEAATAPCSCGTWTSTRRSGGSATPRPTP